MSIDLTDKVAVVTGGGRGIGRSLCQAFATKDAKVVVADINAAGADETLELLEGAHRGEAIHLDVTSVNSWKALRDQVIESYGAIDVLCNNAGVTRLGNVGEFSLDEYHLQNRINIDGVVLGCHVFAKDFIRQESGFIINTSSLAGLVALGGVSTYSASKFAVVGFTQSLAAEMAEHGVQASVLCPSVVDTPMNDELDFPGDEEADMMSPGQVADYVIDAIEANDGRVFIFTDPNYVDIVEETLSLPVKEFRAFVEANK